MIRLLCVVLVLFSACQKKTDDTISGTIKRVSLASDEVFEFSFGRMPFEGGPRIFLQAKTFDVSEIRRAEHDLLYVFKPKAGYQGVQTVVVDYHVSAGGPESVSVNRTIFEFSIQ